MVLYKVPVVSIIDDDESIRIATESLVRSLGYAACVFDSAQEFLHSPMREQTACVITDMQMPGMDGLELQDSLISSGQKLPMIFITAFPEERLRQRAMNNGAIGFLAKPFEAQVIIDCIEKALA